MFVDVDATHRFFKPRLVLYYLKEKVEQELAYLQDDGIISPVCFQIGPPQSILLLKMMGQFVSIANLVPKQDSYHQHVSKMYLLKCHVVRFSPIGFPTCLLTGQM